MTHIPAENRVRLHNSIISSIEVEQEHIPPPVSQTDDEMATSSVSAESKGLLSTLLPQFDDVGEHPSTTQAAAEEVERYKALASCSMETCPLSW